jgi:hypothetical protein
MVDYAIDVYKSLHGEKAAIPEEMMQQKQRVLVELEELKQGCQAVEAICNDKEERVSGHCISGKRKERKKTICFWNNSETHQYLCFNTSPLLHSIPRPNSLHPTTGTWLVCSL